MTFACADGVDTEAGRNPAALRGHPGSIPGAGMNSPASREREGRRNPPDRPGKCSGAPSKEPLPGHSTKAIHLRLRTRYGFGHAEVRRSGDQRAVTRPATANRAGEFN